MKLFLTKILLKIVAINEITSDKNKITTKTVSRPYFQEGGYCTVRKSC